MKKGNIQHILRALKIVWSTSPKWSFINALIVFLKGVLPLLFIFVIQQLVDQVEGNSLTTNTGYVYKVLVFAAFVFVLNAIINAVSGLISEKHSFYINDWVQDKIHEKTVSIDFIHFDDFKFQNVFYRAINESVYRPAKLYYGFISLVQSGITLVLIGGLLFALHWLVVLMLFVFAVPVVFIRLKASKEIYTFKQEHTEDERRVGYYNNILTSRGFAKELRAFDLGLLFKKRYEHHKDGLRNERFSLLKKKAGYEFLFQFFTALSLIFVIGYIAMETMNGQLTMGKMVMFFLALYRGYNYLQTFLGRVSGLYEDGLFLKNLFEFLDYKWENNSTKKWKVFPEVIKDSIRFENVSFKYPNSSRNVFTNLNLNIYPGETVALVGANGAGKSTLIKLMCGLYHPDSGSVCVDDVSISEINTSSLAKNITVVFQDFMLYNVSARENIWFGDINKSNNNPSIIESAKKSGIHQILNNLPQSYDTTLGTLFKDSEMLSQGEWQRIALSRSFFNDAQLVILDEPTSSMDAFTEATLIDNFKSIIKNRTAVIVSHRLSTIHLADRIVVVAENGVVEEGSYTTLLQKKGAFYQMLKSLKESGVQ